MGIKDESLEETENLPEPEVLASDIVEKLEAALDQFWEVSEELEAEELGNLNNEVVELYAKFPS